MPNYCRNTLVVRGDYDVLVDFLTELKTTTYNHLEGKYIDLIETLLPIPETLKETESKFGGLPDPAYEARLKSNMEVYGYPTWYEWAKDNWGSKWSDIETRIERASFDYEIVDGKVCNFYEYEYESKYEWVRFRFDTAWSPPIKAFERISRMYPTLTFVMRYTESGMEYKGEATFTNGTVNDVKLDYIPEWDSDYS